MKNIKIRGNIYLITEKSPQTELFVNYLSEKTGCTIRQQAPSATLAPSSSVNTLLLIDCDHTHVDDLIRWQDNL